MKGWSAIKNISMNSSLKYFSEYIYICIYIYSDVKVEIHMCMYV